MLWEVQLHAALHLVTAVTALQEMHPAAVAAYSFHWLHDFMQMNIAEHRACVS